MQHSKYSPSKSYLWLNCGQALRLMPEESGPRQAAERGHRLHDYMENFVKKHGFKSNKTDLIKTGDDQNEQIKKTYKKFSEWLNNFFRGAPDIEVDLELQVKLDFILPGCFGTSDIIIRVPSFQTIIIADWKFGRVEVSPDSPQLNLYMMGATEPDKQHYESYINVILQPTTRHKIDMHVYTREDYLANLKKYKKDASKNLQKKPRAIVGDHCEHYASCRQNCSAYRKMKITKARATLERLKK